MGIARLTEWGFVITLKVLALTSARVHQALLKPTIDSIQVDEEEIVQWDLSGRHMHVFYHQFELTMGGN